MHTFQGLDLLNKFAANNHELLASWSQWMKFVTGERWGGGGGWGGGSINCDKFKFSVALRPQRP